MGPQVLIPQNLQAERAVLGAALLEPAVLPIVRRRRLQPEDFMQERHRVVYAAILAVAGRGAPVDPITVHAELDCLRQPVEYSYFALLQEEAAVPATIDAYITLILEAAQKRRWLRVGHQLRELAANGQTPAEIREYVERELEGARPRATGPDWPLHDPATPWEFPAIVSLIESLLPMTGVVWWGGLPKRFKSLLLLYLCLAIACRRPLVANHFRVLGQPRILYVTREDPGSRLQERIEDILRVWGLRPSPGSIRFVIRPHLNLLDRAHIAWLLETCQRESATMLVLDTWTALSPTADPLGAQDQAQLAAAVVGLCEAIGGLVVVVDHSRKNRPEGQALSSADIHGPYVKWASAEHVVMLDFTADRRRLEVFVEGKDIETERFFLTWSPRGSAEEKFTFAGSVAEVTDARRALSDRNRQAILDVLQAAAGAVSTGELVDLLATYGVTLSADTVQRHVKALVEAGCVRKTGSGRGTRYYGVGGLPQEPFAAQQGTAE